jgi:hypothetical protein
MKQVIYDAIGISLVIFGATFLFILGAGLGAIILKLIARAVL